MKLVKLVSKNRFGHPDTKELIIRGQVFMASLRTAGLLIGLGYAVRYENKPQNKPMFDNKVSKSKPKVPPNNKVTKLKLEELFDNKVSEVKPETKIEPEKPTRVTYELKDLQSDEEVVAYLESKEAKALRSLVEKSSVAELAKKFKDKYFTAKQIKALIVIEFSKEARESIKQELSEKLGIDLLV